MAITENLQIIHCSNDFIIFQRQLWMAAYGSIVLDDWKTAA